jgi:hypothetical protein
VYPKYAFGDDCGAYCEANLNGPTDRRFDMVSRSDPPNLSSAIQQKITSTGQKAMIAAEPIEADREPL